MKKVAIVGVEGSGKTVMLAVLGALYSTPDDNGCFLEPQNPETLAYVRKVCGRLQKGQWPAATETDCAFGLKWHLRRQSGGAFRTKTVCEFSCLDFAGEVYRTAFSGAKGRGLANQVKELEDYLRGADTIVLLLNLRDSITLGIDDRRAVDAEYCALSMLKFVLEPADAAQRLPRVLLALSQADAYSATIEACGGPKETLNKYLPLVASSFGYLDVVAVNSCGTTIDENGDCVPERNLSMDGLRPMMEWMLHAPMDWRNGWRYCVGCGKGALHAVSSLNWRRICTSQITVAALSVPVVAAAVFWFVSLTFGPYDGLQLFGVWLVLFIMFPLGMMLGSYVYVTEETDGRSATHVLMIAGAALLAAPLPIAFISQLISFIFFR